MAAFDEVCVEVVLPAGIISLEGILSAHRGLAFQRILHRLNFYVLWELVPNIDEVVLMIKLINGVRQRGLLHYPLLARVGPQTYNTVYRLCVPSICVL